MVDQKFPETDQKFPETDQKFPETGQLFFWSTKKNEKKTGQLVDQETDQNHMDRTTVQEIQVALHRTNLRWGFRKHFVAFLQNFIRFYLIIIKRAHHGTLL